FPHTRHEQRWYRIDNLSSASDADRPPFFFVFATATPVLDPLSLHDALPICHLRRALRGHDRNSRRRGSRRAFVVAGRIRRSAPADRKSTRLNSSHVSISYAVFCLKKKNQQKPNRRSALASSLTSLGSWARAA